MGMFKRLGSWSGKKSASEDSHLAIVFRAVFHVRLSGMLSSGLVMFFRYGMARIGMFEFSVHGLSSC